MSTIGITACSIPLAVAAFGRLGSLAIVSVIAKRDVAGSTCVEPAVVSQLEGAGGKEVTIFLALIGAVSRGSDLLPLDFCFLST